MKQCLYCYELKDNSEFSKEHVIPRSIGGNFNMKNNPFLLHNVCGKCNNILGIFVDAPFAKSTLINMHRHEVASKWVNPEKNKIVLLAYMGYNKQILYKDYICEVYLGPTGDTIYHFHKKYPGEKKLIGTVGIPATAKNKKPDNGFAFLFVASNNPVWHPTIFHSFINSFKDSVHYLGNGSISNIEIGNFRDIPSELKDLHVQLLKLQKKKTHNQQLIFDSDCDERFSAKLALGIGAALLNKSFENSEDAAILRKYMREMYSKERKKIFLPFSGLLTNSQGFMEKVTSWEFGHTLLLKEINDGTLVLIANYYGKGSTMIRISTNKEHWRGKIPADGTMYVLIPEKQMFVGPIGFMEFLEHNQKINTIKELQEIEDEINNYKQPPFKI